MKDKIISGFKWDFFGKISNQLVGFGITIILSRLLLPKEFAILAMVTAFSSFVNGFVNMGYSSAIIQRRDVTAVETSSVFFFNVLSGFLVSAIFYFCSTLIASFYQIIELDKIAKTLSLTFIVSSLGLVPMALMEKRFYFKSIMKVNLISATISGILGVFLALNDFGVWSLVYQILVNELLRSILSLWMIRFRPILIFNLTSLKDLSRVGLPIMASGLLNSIFQRLDYIVVGRFFPAELLGLLFRAKSFRELIIRYSSDSLGRVLFPAFSERQDDTDWIRNIATRSLLVLSFIVISFSSLLLLVDYEMFYILFGNNWTGAVPYFQILLLSSVSFPVAKICAKVLISIGKSQQFLKVDIIEKLGLLLGLLAAVMTRDIFYFLLIDMFTRYIVVFIYLRILDENIQLKVGELIYRILPLLVYSIVTIYSLKLCLDITTLSVQLLFTVKGFLFLVSYYVFVKIDLRLNKKSVFFELADVLYGIRKNIKFLG